jgi:hypothetical protein
MHLSQRLRFIARLTPQLQIYQGKGAGGVRAKKKKSKDN